MWSSWVYSLLFAVWILCDSMIRFSRSCCGEQEFNPFVSILGQTRAQGRAQLEPLGVTGLVTLQGIAEALRISRYLLALFMISSENQDHRPEQSKCLVVLSLRPILGFSSAHLFIALRWKLLHDWLMFWSNMSRSCSNLFLCQSALNPHMPFWWISVEQFQSCHSNPGFRQWLVSINFPNIVDGCLTKYTCARFRLSLDINVIQRYRKNRPLWISGFFFVFWRMLLRFSLEVALSSVHSDGEPLSLLEVFASPARECNIFCLSWECPLLLITTFYMNVELLGDPPYPRSKDHQSNSSQRSRDALNLGLLMTLKRVSLLAQREWSTHQTVNWTLVHEAPGHLLVSLAHFGDSSNTPLLQPVSFLAIQTEPMVTKVHLSLVLQFVVHFHLFRIGAEMDLGFSFGRENCRRPLFASWADLVLHG